MPVLMIAHVPNMTEDIYGAILPQLMPVMKTADGFISHAGGPGPDGGWRVVEAWDSEAAAEKWFDANVKPNLPPGIVPERTFHPLHSAFSR